MSVEARLCLVSRGRDYFFFFNDTATTEIYTLSLHDALPIWPQPQRGTDGSARGDRAGGPRRLLAGGDRRGRAADAVGRSEEHTSELQSRQYLVCRLLLEKKKKQSAGADSGLGRDHHQH